MTWRTDGKLKSSMRKPLLDVSNSAIDKPSQKRVAKMIKNLKKSMLKQQEEPIHVNQEEEDPLHHLLLVHSDVSSLLRQIDEIVVEAVKVNIDNEKGEEIIAFTNVLSEIQSSLKPWVLRLQKTLAVPCPDSDVQLTNNSVGPPFLHESEEHDVDTPEPTMPSSLISPSPLVSWRATDFTADVGKQLFLLTPLPRSRTTTSKPPVSVKPTNFKETESIRANGVPSLGLVDDPKSDHNKPENGSELDFLSPSKKLIDDFSTIFMTPSLRNSPPKSCAVREPYPQFSFRKIDQFHKSTPFPVENQKFHDSTDSGSSSGEVSEKLGVKYPELVGIKPSCTLVNERRVFEESPAWIRSPPKCCTLMEPLGEKTVKPDFPLHGCVEKLTSTFNQLMSLVPPKQSTVFIQDTGNKKDGIVMAESTPMWKGPESVIKSGKRPGENTLKKELWTRFEAASSTTGFELDFQETSPQKGFLDRLEEA